MTESPLLTAEQIRRWDAFTIQNEPISSVDLMERAAQACVDWIQKNITATTFSIFCGKGNNGGDGLAIARILHEIGFEIAVNILESGKEGSSDFQANLARLRAISIDVKYIQSSEYFPQINEESIIIDALYGTGLSRPLEGLSAELVDHLNHIGNDIISIDMPSGMLPDSSSKNATIIQAKYILTFQVPKLAFFVDENDSFIGSLHVLDIKLHPNFLHNEKSNFFITRLSHIKEIYKPRKKTAHKGTHGHALIVGGSYGKIGAAVLATKACLRSGAGLTTAYVPRCGYTILQALVPEAMVLTDDNEQLISQVPPINNFTAIGLGPGLGINELTCAAVSQYISNLQQPIVLDADALNCLATNASLLNSLPPYAILTPHPKEFDRLFRESASGFDRLYKAIDAAKKHNIIIILKGHYTAIALPNGTVYFNTTGNAGLAKGGSGDVLTGIITALLAQGYSPANAAIMGVYLHGSAADFAAQHLALEYITASDVITHLSDAFKLISNA